MRGRALLAVALALATGSCARPGPQGVACAIEPVPLERMAATLPLHARLRFLEGGGEIPVDAVAVRESESVVVVGLTPFGMRLFTARVEETGVRVETTRWSRIGPPPEFVWDALRRAFWDGAAAPEPGRVHAVEGEACGYSVRIVALASGPADASAPEAP